MLLLIAKTRQILFSACPTMIAYPPKVFEQGYIFHILAQTRI